MANNVKTNLIFQLFYRVLTVITPLITTPILSRSLGSEKLGVYSASLAFVNYFMLFAMLGIENYGNRSIAAVQGDKKLMQRLFWNVYAIQLIASVLSILGYGISLLLVDNERFLITLFQGLWLISNLINVNWFFFGTEQFRITVIRNTIIKILTVVLIVLLIKTPNDLYIYAIIMAGDAILSNLIMLPFLRKNLGFEKPSFPLMREHIKPIMILFIPILAMSIFHIMDKTMLDVLSTEQNSGFYYAADKLINIPMAAIAALGTVMLPRIANMMGNSKNKNNVSLVLGKSTELMIFLASAVGMGIAAIAKEFVPFFFGDGYEPCVKLIYWFVPVLFVKAISELIRTQYLVPAHEDKKYTLAIISGAVVNLFANYFLIRAFGALGAVLGTLIAETVVSIAQIILTYREIKFLNFILQNIWYVVLSLVMLAVVRIAAFTFNIPDIYKIIVMIVVGGLTYMVLCIIVWKINKKSIFHNLKIKDLVKQLVK